LPKAGRPYDHAVTGFAANGYGEHSPGRYQLTAAFLVEVILQAIARQPYLPNTCFRRSVARAVGFVRIFCSSCPKT
jgi:hypothetical protein